MASISVLWFLLLLKFSFAVFHYSYDDFELEEIESEEGKPFVVPCNLSDVATNPPLIIIIFKDENKFPIFSIDSRSPEGLETARQHAMEEFEGRFELQLRPEGNRILLKDVKMSDAGEYICRMDFASVPTVKTSLKLVVVRPVEDLFLALDSEGDEVRISTPEIGPFPDGTDLNVTCNAVGGSPPAELTWWIDGVEAESSSLQPGSNSTSRGVLFLPDLRLGNASFEVVCKASNSKTLEPVLARVVLKGEDTRKKVRIYPSAPSVVPSRGPQIVTVSEGSKLSLRCDREGGRRDGLDWIKDGRPFNGSGEWSEDPTPSVASGEEGAAESSFLSFRPKFSDNESVISCHVRGSDRNVDTDGDAVQLNVLYKPRVHLSSLNTNLGLLDEGEDVYFNCLASANPPPSKFVWTHQGEDLNASASNVVLNSIGSTMVISKVTPLDSGLYSCKVTNANGSTTSNDLRMEVKYKPKCDSGETFFAGNLNDVLSISCNVHSHPKTKQFSWELASRNSSSDVPNSNQFPTQSKVATIEYRISSPADFSSLLCYASNSVGETTPPCLVSVIPTGKPEPVSKCKIWTPLESNLTSLTCSEGFDGGLPQIFNVKIWQFHGSFEKKSLIESINSSSAFFNLSDLEPNRKFLFNITSVNSKGTSTPVFITFTTSPDFENLTTLVADVKGAPLTVVVIGVVVIIAIALVVLLCFVKVRYFGRGKDLEEDGLSEDTGRDEGADLIGKGGDSPRPVDSGDKSYMSAGRLVIGVKGDKRGHSNSMEKISLLDQDKIESTPEQNHLPEHLPATPPTSNESTVAEVSKAPQKPSNQPLSKDSPKRTVSCSGEESKAGKSQA